MTLFGKPFPGEALGEGLEANLTENEKEFYSYGEDGQETYKDSWSVKSS